MTILGITAYFHDSSAALIVDGKVIIAIQEERLSRKKHDSAFPILAIGYCLEYSNLSIDKVDKIIYYEKPFIKFDRIIRTFISTFPFSFLQYRKVILDWAKNKLFLKNTIKRELKKLKNYFNSYSGDILFSSHHLSHASMGYYSSNFDEAAILVIDAVGEEATTSMFIGKSNSITLLKEYYYPNSIGFLYSSFTQFLGFKVNSDEYKLMGLTAYGDITSDETKAFIEMIKANIISIDGSYFSLNMKYFKFEHGKRMINTTQFENLFNFSSRSKNEQITQTHCNLALAIQTVTEELLFSLINEIKKLTNIENIVISGGVAHNTVAMGKIKNYRIFNKIWVPFAPGDSGTSIGAALAYYHSTNYNQKKRNPISPYLGRDINNAEIYTFFKNKGMSYQYYEEYSILLNKIIEVLKQGKVVAWFQNNSEFGERALGNRSIFMNPSINNGKEILNSKIKFRESFRPFAPVIRKEDAKTYFENDDSDYMQYVTKVNQKYRYEIDSEIDIKTKINLNTSPFGTISHFDYTSRLQTVSKVGNYRLWMLLKKYKEQTGVPILVNTSLNIKGEPIVETIEDAFNTFINSGIDYLVLGNFIVKK